MTSCFICKNTKSKEYTVRGFFDKSKLLAQYQEIPEEVFVHISCSLLFKDTRVQQANGNWEVRGLEEIIKYQILPCQSCKQPFDWRSRPFIINCNYNECLDIACSSKNKCSKHHCKFPFDLGCLQYIQIYNIFLESEDIIARLKFFCLKHSSSFQNSFQKAKPFSISQIQENIMQRFFLNVQNPLRTNQFNYQANQITHQPVHPASGEQLQGQIHDQNDYIQKQGQHYNQPKQQVMPSYGNTNSNQNKQQYKQGEMEGYQPQIQQQYPVTAPPLSNQQYDKNNSNQQKQSQASQGINNPQVFQKQNKSGQVTTFQNEQFSQPHHQKFNSGYSNSQQSSYQQYDINGRLIQVPPPSTRINYQGGNSIPSNNQPYDQNAVIPPTQQTVEASQYSTQNPTIPQPVVDQQKIPTVAPQAQNIANQYPKNQQPHRQWDQNSKQYQQQHAYNQHNLKPQYPNQTTAAVPHSYQQHKQGIYKTTANVNQPGFNEDTMQPMSQYNQPKQYQAGQQINQDYNNTQNTYNIPPNQSNQRGFSSNYQSAQFAEAGAYNNMYNNDTYGNQINYDRQDSLQQNQQVGAAIEPVQAHDNTYSFTSNNPPTALNKQPTQEYQTNTQNNTTTPQVQTYSQNSTARKTINPNVDTNPNGISVDITDQIKLQKFYQQNRKAQDQQQSASATTAAQSQQGYGENMTTDNSQYQKTNSTLQSAPGLAPTQVQAPIGEFRNLNQQQNPQQNAIPNKYPHMQQYYQNQNFPNNNSYQQGVPQNQHIPFQNTQGQQYNQNYSNQQFQSMPNQNFSNQGQIQQPPNQNSQASYPNSNMNNQQNNNFPYGVQSNVPFAPIQEKQRANVPPQREKSQQSTQSFNQNDQANFSVPMYRRPSQQQQFAPPQNQYPPIQPSTQPLQQQQTNDNTQPYNINGQQQQNNTMLAQENENQMNIEESNLQANQTNSAAQEAVLPTAPLPKKRGGGKRVKKGTEAPQNEALKLNDVPLKHTKSAQKKMDKKKGKKATQMDQEEEDGAGQSNQQGADQQMKDESSNFQPNRNQAQENNVPNIQNNNIVQQQFGSENNIQNKIESQESLDLKSQTSLGIQVQRQNQKISKEQKSSHGLNQQPLVNVQQVPIKNNTFQPPVQSVNHSQPSQNIIHPPPLSKQSSMQSFTENQQNPIFDQQLIQNNLLPRHPSGSVQPSSIAAQQMNRPIRTQNFQQQALRPHQTLKKKSGPLINDSYKPFFVELVEVQHQIQQFQYQERMALQHHQQQMLMRHQLAHGQIIQNNSIISKQQYQQLSIPSTQNFGQMTPPPPPHAPQLNNQNQNVPFINPNPQQVMQQVIPPQQYPKVGQNGQQNPINGANNQQIVQGTVNQNQKLNPQNPNQVLHHHQQPYPQGAQGVVQQASQEFKNEIGNYHPQNQNQGEISKIPSELQKNVYRQQYSNQSYPQENLQEALKQNNQPLQQNAYQQHQFPQPILKNNEAPNFNNNYQQNPAQNAKIPYSNQFQQGGQSQSQTNLYRDQKNQDSSDKKYSNNQINSGNIVTNNLNNSFNPTQNNQYYSQQANQFPQHQYNLEKQNNTQHLQSQRSISSQQQSYSQQNLVVSNTHLDSTNMIKSNNFNNIYSNQGGPFRSASGANLALNASVQQISAIQNNGVQNRQSSIQSSEQLFQGPGFTSNQNQNLQTTATSIKTLKQIDENVESIREEDIFGEEITESEESFWDYCSPENFQHLLPQQQSNQSNQQFQRNKSKLGGVLNNQGSNQAQQKQTKKGQASNHNQSTQKDKDPYFGIDPTKLIVKNFPQGEDEESVFQWWDQIDEVYFPNTIKEGFFNMLEVEKSKNISEILQSLDIVEVDENGLVRRIPPIKFIQQLQNGVTENSSLYYLIAKDHYEEEPIPYKHPNYFSVLFYNQLNNNDSSSDQQDSSSQMLKRLQQPNNGVLAVFKLKMYDKKRPMTCEDKNIFDKFITKIDIIAHNNIEKIEDVFQKLDYSLQIQNSIEKQELNKIKKQSKQQNKDKQDISKFEPELTKQFVGNNQIIPISQFKQEAQIQNQNDFLYDKNKVTFKLKKLITLNSSAVYSAFQSTNFLNKFLKSQKKLNKLKDQVLEQEDSDSETTKEYLQGQNGNLSPIECNIIALEYELTKLQTHQQLNQLKENVFKNSKQEGNYLELRNLSVKINDNLKWLTIRKNLILGFSDRQRYDSENYFKYEAEEKSGINLSRSEVLQEKEILEKMSSTEKENLNQQQLLARQLQQMQRIKRNNQKQEEEEDEEDEDQGDEKSQFNNKDKRQRNKQNDDNEDDEEEDYNEDDEDGDEDESNPIENENKKKEDLKRSSRASNRIKRILEDENNGTNLSNENSIDGLELVQESDRLESPSVNRNKEGDDLESDQRKVDKKNKLSSSSNNKKKKKQKQKSKSKFLEIDCSVCFHHVNNENNTVVYCSQCNGSFHKHCYGIDFIPEERFLCRKCEIKNLQILKKKSNTSCQKQPLKEEISKQFHCKLCTETLLPVISIFDDSYFYHPTCLFLFNYAIYKDQRLQLRDTVTHTSISEDVKKQNHIACEFCHSKKGLKVKCCHFGKPRKLFQQVSKLSRKKLASALKRSNKLNIENKIEYQDLEKSDDTQKIPEAKQEKLEDEVKQEELDKNFLIKQETEIIKKEESEEDEYDFSDEEEDEFLDDEDEEEYEELGCNYYIHPLCAFLNGFEVWLDSRDEDPECEKTIVDSDFQNLQHLGLKIFFKCKEHADRKNRNYDEQVYYRRYQINYRNICQYTTFQEYQQSITKQRTHEEEQWNEIVNMEKEYIENYKYYTKIKLNRKEIEISYQQSELFYQQNPGLKEQLHLLELEEIEEEAQAQNEQENLMLVKQQNLQHQSLQNVDESDEDDNIAQTNNLIEEGNSLDEIDNKNTMEDELDEDDENSQFKRRSRRHLQKNQQPQNQLSGRKSNPDIQDDFLDQIENEYSQDDIKKDTNRRRALNLKRNQQKAGLISQSSLSGGGTGETNKNRRSSRRLVNSNNNQKGKSQYSSFLNVDEEEENQDSSFNQGYSSFENTLNKINLKEFSNSQPICLDKNSVQIQQQSSLVVLSQITSNPENKQVDEAQQEEEFKGISKKDQKVNQTKQKGKKSFSSKFNDDEEEDLDEDFEIENESLDDFEDDELDEDDPSGQKFAQKRGIGKFGRNKKVKSRRNQSKYNQNDISSSSLENAQNLSNSRGSSPPNKPNGSVKNNQDIQKVLSNARSLAKNGKIGKGTSIFAVQNKKRKVQKKIGSRNSLLSIENDEEEDLINEISLDKDDIQKQDEFNHEISYQINQEDELTRNQEQHIIIQQEQKLLAETDQAQTKSQVDSKEEGQMINEHIANSNLLDAQNNSLHLKRSKSPSIKNTQEQEQVQKHDLEGDSLKILAQNSDNQQQANQTKYNLRQHRSKNYKNNNFKEDNDFVYINNSQFIKLQQNAFSQFGNDSVQNEEEISSNLPQNNLQNKKKQSSQTNIPQEDTPKQKSKKNQKQGSTNQTKKGQENTAENEQNEESFSSIINQQANNQNEIEITNQFSLNSHHSQEETHSNEQKQSVKGKISKKKQNSKPHPNQYTKQNKKVNNRKGQTHEQEQIQAHKISESSISVADHHSSQNNFTQSSKNFQINNPNESQELLDFDQFEQKDQILNPNNLKYN